MAGELAVSIVKADGTVVRWAGDEPSAQNVPRGLKFSTAMPGGFETLSCSLPRRIDVDSPDLNLLDTIRVYGPGGQVAWEGRQQQFPRSHGTDFAIQIGAVGWSAHMKDDQTFREIYVDRDLSRWTTPSRARQVALLTSNLNQQNTSVLLDPTGNLPALACIINGNWTSPAQPISEALYDAGPGLKVGIVYYDFLPNANVNPAVTQWTWGIIVTQNDTDSPSGSSSGNLRAASGAAYFNPATPNRFAIAQLYFSATGSGNAGTTYELDWRNLTVYGNHGLAGQGTDPKGFYASDVIANAISRAAPLLTFTTGASGTIQPTTLAIPHLVFRDPVSVDQVVLQANGYHLWDWAVWENRTFYFQPADPNRLTWVARLADGAQLQLEGATADEIVNGVVVIYQDAGGDTQIVGPPGLTGATATSSLLQDTSVSNPANAHSITRKWKLISLSVPSYSTAAVAVGAAWLAEAQLAARRGTLTLTGTVTHPTMPGPQPVWMVRAGDWIRVGDQPSAVQRKIIHTDYDHDTRTLTCSVDNTSHKVDALISRITDFAGLG